MNTNDNTLPIAQGRCDLKPVPTVESLQARIRDLEAAASVARRHLWAHDQANQDTGRVAWAIQALSEVLS